MLGGRLRGEENIVKGDIMPAKSLRKGFIISVISNVFSDYNNSLKESEEYFNGQAKSVIPYSEKELAKLPEDERDSMIDWYLDDYLKYRDSFPTTLRNSYLMGYYSIYDYYLNSLCTHAKNILNKDIEIDLIKGEGIWRSRVYLEKICCINISDCSEWNEIIMINKIRNSFVHNLGKAIKRSEIEQYFSKNKQYLDIDDHDRIKIKNGYLENIAGIMEKHLLDVTKKIFA